MSGDELVPGSMVNRWNRWHRKRDEPKSMGHLSSYARAAAWLDVGGRLEDWGGGTGFARRYVAQSEYVLVDGSDSKFRDVAADLVTYRPTERPTSILLRHVIDHNRQWAAILDNAVASFGERLVVVTFQSFADETYEVIGGPIPTLRFRRRDLTDRFEPNPWRLEELAWDRPPGETEHYHETIFYVSRGAEFSEDGRAAPPRRSAG